MSMNSSQRSSITIRGHKSNQCALPVVIAKLTDMMKIAMYFRDYTQNYC